MTTGKGQKKKTGTASGESAVPARSAGMEGAIFPASGSRQPMVRFTLAGLNRL
jgi:hypothetical protein